MDESRPFGRLFLLGLGLGLIPMALLFLSISWTPFCFGSCSSAGPAAATRQLASALGSVGLWLWGLATLTALVMVFFRRLQPISYGLLIMVLITPVAAVVGCVVRLPSPYG